MPRRLRENGLSIVLFGLFAVFLLGIGLTSWRTYNAEPREHHEQTVGLGTYLTTGHFVEATFENWESEFLQMASYVLLTVWLVQKASSESKPLGGDPEKDTDPRSVTDPERAPGPVRRGGWWLVLYENSLGIALALLFMLSFVLHALGGAREYSAEQVAHGQQPVSAIEFVTTSTFWFQSSRTGRASSWPSAASSYSPSSSDSGGLLNRSLSLLLTTKRVDDEACIVSASPQ